MLLIAIHEEAISSQIKQKFKTINKSHHKKYTFETFFNNDFCEKYKIDKNQIITFLGNSYHKRLIYEIDNDIKYISLYCQNLIMNEEEVRWKDSNQYKEKENHWKHRQAILEYEIIQAMLTYNKYNLLKKLQDNPQYKEYGFISTLLEVEKHDFAKSLNTNESNNDKDYDLGLFLLFASDINCIECTLTECKFGQVYKYNSFFSEKFIFDYNLCIKEEIEYNEYNRTLMLRVIKETTNENKNLELLQQDIITIMKKYNQNELLNDLEKDLDCDSTLKKVLNNTNLDKKTKKYQKIQKKHLFSHSLYKE